MRTHVDLFSGIGGFSLACQWAGVETIAFAEIDSYASRVLQRHWPNVRNYGDVRGFPSLSAWLLTAGVPCQPASVAGKRQGAADDRWLWPQTLAVVENGAYKWLLFENPTGILSLNDGLEFERICAALEGQGYEVQPLVIPACGVGAKHRRYRVWIVAHSTRERAFSHVAHAERRGRRQPAGITTAAWQSFCAALGEESALEFGSSGETMAHADSGNGYGRGGDVQVGRSGSASATKEDCYARGNQWSIEPDVGRVAHGIPRELDFIGGLEREQGDGKKSQPEVEAIIRRMLLAMWKHRELAEASPDLYARNLCHSVPELSYSPSRVGWFMGSRYSQDEGLRGMWNAFYSKPLEETQDLQPRLLERIREAQREQTMAFRSSRVNRLRGLGNAIVPQVAFQLIKRMIEAEESWQG